MECLMDNKADFKRAEKLASDLLKNIVLMNRL